MVLRPRRPHQHRHAGRRRARAARPPVPPRRRRRRAGDRRPRAGAQTFGPGMRGRTASSPASSRSVTGGASGIGLRDGDAALARRGASVAVLDLDPRTACPTRIASVRVRRHRPSARSTPRSQASPSRLGRPRHPGQQRRHRRGRHRRGQRRRRVARASSTSTWSGIARVTAAALPHLRRSPAAAIVNLCSIAALNGLPQRALYCASKGAVLALTLAMATDHVARGHPGQLRQPGHRRHAASSTGCCSASTTPQPSGRRSRPARRPAAWSPPRRSPRRSSSWRAARPPPPPAPRLTSTAASPTSACAATHRRPDDHDHPGRTFLVDVAVETERTDAVQSFVKQETIFVTVERATGSTASATPTRSGRGVAQCCRCCATTCSTSLIGQDADRIEALWHRLFASTRATTTGAITSLALAAIDTALWDVAAQRAGPAAVAPRRRVPPERAALRHRGRLAAPAVDELVDGRPRLAARRAAAA